MGLDKLIEKQKTAYQERFKHSQFIEHASIIAFLEASAREIAETLYREIRPEHPVDKQAREQGLFINRDRDDVDDYIFEMEKRYQSYCEKV